jgi:hypothetical protein
MKQREDFKSIGSKKKLFRKRPLGRQRTYEDRINKDLKKWVMIRR